MQITLTIDQANPSEGIIFSEHQQRILEKNPATATAITELVYKMVYELPDSNFRDGLTHISPAAALEELDIYTNKLRRALTGTSQSQSPIRPLIEEYAANIGIILTKIFADFGTNPSEGSHPIPQ